ncbi:MAG: class I SAM-dependent methyltransferase [Lutibacter sp.]|nr:class I SAM-dependent methyltransferase [Lutibacter sp.]MBP9601148.1 class I SAM-dependent methyltransferase [Lutibacter sp.]
MNLEVLKENIDKIDIYILDQILKERYQPGDILLDAGCGKGRNLKWFYNYDIEIVGIDTESEALNTCKELYPKQKDNFIQASVDKLPFEANSFNHIICNAVLHFAKNELHFFSMLNELIRVLKPNGSLFIRIASNFGIENDVEYLEKGNYKLPDGSTRFLLTQDLLNTITLMKEIQIVEAVKTTIVHGKRCMTTLVIEKVS